MTALTNNLKKSMPQFEKLVGKTFSFGAGIARESVKEVYFDEEENQIIVQTSHHKRRVTPETAKRFLTEMVEYPKEDNLATGPASYPSIINDNDKSQIERVEDALMKSLEEIQKPTAGAVAYEKAKHINDVAKTMISMKSLKLKAIDLSIKMRSK